MPKWWVGFLVPGEDAIRVVEVEATGPSKAEQQAWSEAYDVWERSVEGWSIVNIRRADIGAV